MTRDYEFVTVWAFDSPVEPIWKEIKNSGSWPDWWKGVLEVVEIEPGDDEGVGKVVRSTWKSILPYKLTFNSEVVRVERMKIIEARAFGELEGRGLWQFFPESEDRTRVKYDWRVKTTKPWMNFLRPAAEPFFRWNHDTIMQWGAEGLSRKLGCKLLP